VHRFFFNLEQAILGDIFNAFVEITWRCIHLGGHCTLHFPLSVFVSVRESFHALESGEAVNILANECIFYLELEGAWK